MRSLHSIHTAATLNVIDASVRIFRTDAQRRLCITASFLGQQQMLPLLRVSRKKLEGSPIVVGTVRFVAYQSPSLSRRRFDAASTRNTSANFGKRFSFLSRSNRRCISSGEKIGLDGASSRVGLPCLMPTPLFLADCFLLAA